MSRQADLFQQGVHQQGEGERKPAVDPKLPNDWKEKLKAEFSKEYFHGIKSFLIAEKQAAKTVYPPGRLIFNAFNSLAFNDVKVVILGQDPYHGKGQAHGLCFSVPDGVRMPPSLVNIFKEISDDLGLPMPNSGNLQPWVSQGVLLLNAVLTVRASQPASHSQIGWQTFTDKVISTLSEQRDGLVFMLWGKFAQGKIELIDTEKHLVLTAPHPSPYSANYGFFGCKHFSKANQYLSAKGYQAINWAI